jgi:hypothetical protein
VIVRCHLIAVKGGFLVYECLIDWLEGVQKNVRTADLRTRRSAGAIPVQFLGRFPHSRTVHRSDNMAQSFLLGISVLATAIDVLHCEQLVNKL